MNFDKIVDAFMFREPSDEDSFTNKPKVTYGSIVWGVIMRSAILVFLSLIIVNYFALYSYWWFTLFLIWFLAIYPGWTQYQAFSKRIEEFSESTLCGSCKYFEKSGQLCSLYDEHVSKEHIPCDGDNWQPKSFEDQ